MPFGIEDVYLFFKYCVGEDIGTEELSDLQKNFVELFKKIMDTLYDMYKDKLKDDILNILKVDKFTCEKYTTTILSKCVKLSETPDYLHFVVVCAFLYGIISERYSSRICPSLLANWISRCLGAVYDRCYRNHLRDNCGSETLESCCETLNTEFSKSKLPQDFKKSKNFRCISELMDSDYPILELRDSEVTMAREISEQLSDDSLSDLDDSNISVRTYSSNDSVIESDDTQGEETVANVSEYDSLNGAYEDNEISSHSDMSFDD